MDEIRAYLDNSATTRPFDEVIEEMGRVMRDIYGNPSSMHMAGVNAEIKVKAAKEQLAEILKVEEKEIFFTSGGTESDNLALIGCAMANKRAGCHLITTKTEHPAILETMKYLEGCGFSVTYLDVDEFGRVRNEDLKCALREDTILVSVMQVNNEVGSLNDIETLARTVKEYNPNIIFHVDAVQSFTKIKLYPKRMKVDLVSISGHKIHGPKGMGILYVNDKIKILPIIYGGGQQKGMRSGTENVPGITGIGLAAKLCFEKFEDSVGKLYELKEFFIKELGELPDVKVNAIAPEGIRYTAPHIVSASFSGVRAEVLLHALEAKGIYVSAGSACASNKPAVSSTLTAMGIDKKLLDATLRFSFSEFTTKEELEYTISVLKEELSKLRKYSRR